MCSIIIPVITQFFISMNLIKIPSLEKLIILFIACIISVPIIAQNPQAKANIDKNNTILKVGFAGSEPFVFHEDNQWTGISPKVWEAMISEKDWQYKSFSFQNVSEAIAALEAGKIDVVVGPVSITAKRAEKVQFTQPYFQSSLSILSRVDDPTIWERIAPFFSLKLVYALFVFLVILGCVGTLLWLAERKESPEQFPKEPARGIGAGMWCAIVTMSTTGYGDIAPVTLFGRIVAGSWMIISIIFATTMVAGIASTLTLSGLGNTTVSNAEQLKNKKIAVLENSPSIEFVEEHNGNPVSVKNLNDAYALLKDKKVAAVVFDRPQLQYFLEQHPDEQMTVSIAEYQKQGYGFAFSIVSDRVHDMNIELLQLRENGVLMEITSDWLGNLKH